MRENKFPALLGCTSMYERLCMKVENDEYYRLDYIITGFSEIFPCSKYPEVRTNNIKRNKFAKVLEKTQK